MEDDADDEKKGEVEVKEKEKRIGRLSAASSQKFFFLPCFDMCVLCVCFIGCSRPIWPVRPSVHPSVHLFITINLAITVVVVHPYMNMSVAWKIKKKIFNSWAKSREIMFDFSFTPDYDDDDDRDEDEDDFFFFFDWNRFFLARTDRQTRLKMDSIRFIYNDDDDEMDGRTELVKPVWYVKSFFFVFVLFFNFFFKFCHDNHDFQLNWWLWKILI